MGVGNLAHDEEAQAQVGAGHLRVIRPFRARRAHQRIEQAGQQARWNRVTRVLHGQHHLIGLRAIQPDVDRLAVAPVLQRIEDEVGQRLMNAPRIPFALHVALNLQRKRPADADRLDLLKVVGGELIELQMGRRNRHARAQAVPGVLHVVKQRLHLRDAAQDDGGAL